MKKVLLAFILLSNIQSSIMAQTETSSDLRIQDRIAIKNVVDTFSILADQKETNKQTFLFTEDGVVESKVNGQSGMALKGRKQIGDAFASYLSLFDVVYHINGQQTISFSNDSHAKAISYCLVVLIGNENGKKIKTTMGVYYNDDFVKQNNKWLIEKRLSNFVWQERTEIK